MATRELHEDDEIDTALARRLAREAARINATAGDPTKVL
jgi:hypothetical protein